jgi:hypothetical protein
MPFRLFHDYFREMAKRETRSITVLPHSGLGLPAGDYGFLEMFCDEPGCDCRRVFLMVVASFRRDPQAVVAWGWEDLGFYANWMRYGNRKDAKDLRGPILNPGSPVTDLSSAILKLARDALLKDTDYVERVKRHYRMFRDRVDGRSGRGS